MRTLVTLMVIFAVTLNVSGQVLLKWRIGTKEGLPEPFSDKWAFISTLLIDPFIILAFTCVFGASVLWIFSLSKVELSWAYPFMGLSFVMILGLSTYLFGETLNAYKIIGSLLITSGVVVSYLSVDA